MTDSPPVSESDFDALLELLSPDTMRDVVRLFCDAVPGRVASADAGLASGDNAAVATAFHTLRSGCGQLGARQMEGLCASGERAAKTGHMDDASALLDSVRTEYARCHEWFVAHGWLGA